MQTLSYMRTDYVIVITDIDSKYSYKLANYFGVNDEMLPALRIVDFKGKNNSPRKFSLSKEVNVESILEFVNKWESNSMYDMSTQKSHNTKQMNPNSVALNINMMNFYEKVVLNKKNVVVMFYAEWCSQCKKHLPLFDIVSKKLNQVIYSYVYVDIGDFYDENVKIEKVPYLRVYPSFDKENPIEYTGEIKPLNVVNFLKTNIEKIDDL